MLTDTERKVFRILWNRNRQNAAFIDIPFYARLAGREEGQVRKALEKLAELRCIEWDPVFKRVQVIDTFQLTGPIQKKESEAKVIPWWEWD